MATDTEKFNSLVKELGPQVDMLRDLADAFSVVGNNSVGGALYSIADMVEGTAQELKELISEDQ